MSKQDYYELLGIRREADAEELKRAYRKLAMQYHPDRNPGDAEAEQRFKQITEAYDVLKDDQKRAAYDRFGHAAFSGPSGNGNGAGGFDFGAGFADIFDEMFGEFMGQKRGGGNTRGSDLRYNLEISLENAFSGTNITISVPSSQPCDTCHGSGAEPGSQPITCTACQGSGRIRSQQGLFMIERTCSACSGNGRVIERPCTSCRGGGRVRKEKTLSVAIPAGVEEGTRIRVANEGEASARGGATGDLYIFISIAAHDFFQRDGANIFCKVPIPMTTAALGGTIEVPTLGGSRARINISAGTQTGNQFRLRGKGMSVLRSTIRGDMLVEVMVETPVKLTKRQEELLREFAGEEVSNETSPQSHGFFAKVRELWEGLTE